MHRTLPTHSQAQVHFSQNKPTGYFKEGFQPFEEFKRTLKAFLLSRCLNSSLSHHLEMKCSPPGRFTLCVTSWLLLGRRPSGDLSLSVITSLFKKVHIHVQSGSKICEHCGEKPRPFLRWERHQHFPKESSVRTLISWPPLSLLSPGPPLQPRFLFGCSCKDLPLQVCRQQKNDEETTQRRYVMSLGFLMPSSHSP